MDMGDDVRREDGIALIITMLLLMLLLALGTGLLATATVESAIATNERWSEGAFYAAEAAIQTQVDQLAQGDTDGVVDDTDLGQGFFCRSGGRDDDDPTPPEFIATIEAQGYSVAEGTGYGSGTHFVFDVYQVTGTGTGPRNAAREIEVQVQVGPRAQ
jgi:hypothetical protein